MLIPTPPPHVPSRFGPCPSPTPARPAGLAWPGPARPTPQTLKRHLNELLFDQVGTQGGKDPVDGRGGGGAQGPPVQELPVQACQSHMGTLAASSIPSHPPPPCPAPDTGSAISLPRPALPSLAPSFTPHLARSAPRARGPPAPRSPPCLSQCVSCPSLRRVYRHTTEQNPPPSLPTPLPPPLLPPSNPPAHPPPASRAQGPSARVGRDGPRGAAGAAAGRQQGLAHTGGSASGGCLCGVCAWGMRVGCVCVLDVRQSTHTLSQGHCQGSFPLCISGGTHTRVRSFAASHLPTHPTTALRLRPCSCPCAFAPACPPPLPSQVREAMLRGRGDWRAVAKAAQAEHFGEGSQRMARERLEAMVKVGGAGKLGGGGWG